jgi:hypothetical protein
MDVKEFVRETLLQITQGVSEAQHKASGGIVNPRMRLVSSKTEDGGNVTEVDAEGIKGSGLLMTNYQYGVASMIEFDIATPLCKRVERCEVGRWQNLIL